MFIIENGFYIIDDQYFLDFPDPFLRGNREENRPHYYCFREDNSPILWVIPLSSKVEKYKAEILKKRRAGKPCDVFYILKIAGRESVFLIGDMFPVTENYIKREYTIGNIHLKLKDKHHIFEINKRAKKVLNLIRRKIKFNPTQPDVLKIEQKLLEMNTSEI